MIVTPEHLIKQYFPEPVETTRDLYNRLDLNESGYSYLNWLNDLEEHCLSKYVDASDYKLLPDNQKNYWISPRAFRTIIQASPSKICDQIRACLTDIAHKVATDPAFARQLQDQIDQEAGIEKVMPRVSKALKSKYNQTGKDAFEFSIQENNRLGMDIISGCDFQPGQKIEDAIFVFKFEVENNVPYHLVEITLFLTNDLILSYRTVWSCIGKRQQYGAILMNKLIRINLFEDNRKLVDSYYYIFNQSEMEKLQAELEKAIAMIVELNPAEIDIDRLGEKILNRHNLNEQAYALAIKAVIAAMPKDLEKESAGVIEAAFLDAVNQYWEYYVLRPDPARDSAEDLPQMVKDRIPRVTVALTAGDMLYYNDLCDKYFKRSYSDKQKQALIKDGNLQLIYALSAATEFDPGAAPDRRIADLCAFIADHFEVMKKMFIELGQWPDH